MLVASPPSDHRLAARCLERMAQLPQARRSFSRVQPHILAALGPCADPDRALVNFEHFATAADPNALFPYLGRNPRAVEILITVFAASQFLTEILLRNPEYFNLLVRRKQLMQPKTMEQFYTEAMSDPTPGMPLVEHLDALRRYQRSQLLRIGTCDLLDYFDLPTTTGQLSNLAVAMVRACMTLIASGSRQRARTRPSQVPKMAVIALGKLGGEELNYSSDIDLLFVAPVSHEKTIRLAERLIDALSASTSEGFLYRVDMRLRPWGNEGPLVSTVEGYLSYLSHHALLWEKQALLKAFPIAGDSALGEELLRRAEPHIFGSSPDRVRASVHSMKQRTESDLRRQGRHWGEVKLGEGSIRDIEFVVQYLQMAYGGAHPGIRSRATLKALPRLAAAGFLTPDEARILTDGYIFLRTIEHHLQMMHFRQTHTLPSDPSAIAGLARRLGFRESDGGEAADRFSARYRQHGAAIRGVYTRLLGSDVAYRPAQTSPEINRHLSRLDAAYAITFSETDIRRHAELADRIDEGHPAIVDAEPINGGSWRVTIVAYDYPGELAIICGLLFVYGLNINSGEAFTYEPAGPDEAGGTRHFVLSSESKKSMAASGTQRHRKARAASGSTDVRRKIVDVFSVTPIRPGQPDWTQYNEDLVDLLKKMRIGQRREAHGEIAKRVGTAFQERSDERPPLYPVDIEIDNDLSEHYTALRIDTPDTIGFLYEFTNALALNRIYISRVIVQSVGSRVHDTLFVTDEQGRKIQSPEKQRQLRAATVLIKHFTHLLPSSPNPAAALLHFHEFLGQLFERPNWPDELTSIERSDVLVSLARVLGVSDFLWDDFLRMQYASLFPVVRDVDALATAKSRDQLSAELAGQMSGLPAGRNWRAVLNAFKDREMFRIDMRHLLGHMPDFWTFAAELTDLAEVIVKVALGRCYDEIVDQHGIPVLEDGRSCPVSAFALGKFGGRELGFASDIELMIVYGGKGKTKGPSTLATAEFFEKLAQSFVSSIHARREGVFEVDLQLRPYGKTGSMAVSLEAFRRYFSPDGPAWAYERQALVNLRPVSTGLFAGDEDLATQVVDLRDRFVYSGDPFDVTAMRAMRERQICHLVTGGAFNAKYSPGGLVDVEYLVQGLQVTYGAANPALRLTNIREAMAALNKAGILSSNDYRRLRKAYTFLRWLIDSLRVVRGNARDITVPPHGSDEFTFLARRLLYGTNLDRLRDDLARYTADVRELNTRLLM
ncbi:MAG TPA: hypothetical protein VMB77_02125 [Syntrophales bacterium]|nr:hypothetical protein [Syntrophales bacterium]